MSERHRIVMEQTTPQIDPLSEFSLRYYVDVVRRRWVVVAGLMVLVLVIGLFLEWRRPDAYTVRVLVRTAQEGSDLPAGLSAVGQRALGVGGGGSAAEEVETIRTRRVLERVVDGLNLQLSPVAGPGIPPGAILDADLPDAPPAGPVYDVVRRDSIVVVSVENEATDSLSTDVGWLAFGETRFRVRRDPVLSVLPTSVTVLDRSAAVDALRRGLALEPVERTSLIRIGYTALDPGRAALVANAVAEAYRAASAERAREEARRRREFLASRLQSLRDSLELAQEELLSYQAAAGTVDPEGESEQLLTLALSLEGEVQDLRMQVNLVRGIVQAFREGRDPEPLFRRMMVLGAELFPSVSLLYESLRAYQADRSRLTVSPVVGRAESAPEVQRLDSLITETQEELRQVASETLDILEERLELLEDRLAGLRGDVERTPRLNTAYGRYLNQVQTLQGLHEILAERYFSAQLSEAVEEGDIEILDPAIPPRRPDPSNTLRNLLLALVLGFMIGMAGAVLIDQWDTTLWRSSDVEAASGLEVLGVIPVLSGRQTANGKRPVVVGKQEAETEAFNMLAANILALAPSRHLRKIGITSPASNEGRSVVAANLAAALADAGGRRVLLVDADIRRPVQHSIFGLPRGPGLSDWVLDGSTGTPVRATAVENLALLTAGTPVENPALLLAGDRFRSRVDSLREDYDVVIFDTPPVLAASEATLLAPEFDGVLLVSRLGESEIRGVEQAVRRLRRVGAPLLGLVINGERGSDVAYYGRPALHEQSVS